MKENKVAFRFKYSTLVWVLLIFVLTISFVALVWNVYSLATYALLGDLKIITHAVMIAITVFLCVLVVSVMSFGRYVVTDKYLIQYFGIIQSKTLLKDIVQIAHFKKSNKLVAYFKEQKYTVIVIDPSLYEKFVFTVRAQNPSVIFDIRIDGEDTPE